MQRNPLIFLKLSVDLDKIFYGGDDIEDDLDYILFNVVASTISKWRTLNY
jgi:hypothetical protein